jgi:hypothetical protein
VPTQSISYLALSDRLYRKFSSCWVFLFARRSSVAVNAALNYIAFEIPGVVWTVAGLCRLGANQSVNGGVVLPVPWMLVANCLAAVELTLWYVHCGV